MTEISTIIRARLSNGRSISDEDVRQLLAERDALQARVTELKEKVKMCRNPALRLRRPFSTKENSHDRA